jgi:hypothetical protein
MKKQHTALLAVGAIVISVNGREFYDIPGQHRSILFPFKHSPACTLALSDGLITACEGQWSPSLAKPYLKPA